MRFLIQTIEGEIKHDFSFTLIQAIDFARWQRQDKDFIPYETCNNLNTIPVLACPVGSNEFVCEYYEKLGYPIPKPKNIPDELLRYEFTRREVFNGTEKDVVGVKFIKSNDKIKSFTEIVPHPFVNIEIPKGNYQISDVIDIDSEWRAFIYNGELVGLQNYIGDFKMFPDVPLIEKMITEYKSQPISYTLDVGIFNNRTFIIEVHDFFSCGLYGFANLGILPYMFYRWHHNYITSNL